MKKSWQPQYRSSVFCNPLIWIVGGIILVFCLFVFYVVTKNEVVWLILGGYLFAAYVTWEEARRWETYGYKKITIDSDNYKIIFDDSVEVPFASILDISLDSAPIPPKPWWLRSKNDWDEQFREFNGFFVFHLSTGEVIDFSVQNKYKANEISKVLKSCNLKVYMSDVTECHLNGTYQLIFVIIAIVVIFACIILK